ncbi:mitochondrial glycine transporter B-like [Saccoglossus kowalevskii]|uniref:Mitochondrial glycine transporter n=1 Tax=Saccoglossus kowalevskii TaxID=10224 RepID=A0ABM0GML1_SACKO|nr:PREDICTED: solute carrier family 25 member 38-like [Saccoglossus kowalevskii]
MIVSHSEENSTEGSAKLKQAAKTSMDYVFTSPLCKSFLAGSVSGTCSTVIFQPLDLLKTKLQAPISIGHHGNTGMVQTFIKVVRNERIAGLWRGMVPSITRCVPGVGMYFCTLQWMKNATGFIEPSPLQAVCLGAASRCVSGLTMLPVTVVKTRFESGRFHYRGVIQALKNIYLHEGAKGLYCGATATLLRDVPFSGLYLMFYTQTKKVIPTDNVPNSAIPIVHFGCGVFAGILASAVTQPFDVIKTHMQLYPDKYRSVVHATLSVIKVHGAKGLLRGMLPRCLRRTLMAAMVWTVYEQVLQKMALK